MVLVAATLMVGVSIASADDWPQWLGPQRDGVWRESGILSKFPAGGPKVRWRAPIGGGYAGPAVANGKVYVHDRLVSEDLNSAKTKGPTPGQERVLCLDEASGKVLWTYAYPCQYRIQYTAGPRCTPTVHEGKVYALGAMGDLLCLGADDGRLIWSKSFMRDYQQRTAPTWGWASHPLVDGDKVIVLVGGKGSAVAAFHKDTGKEIWRALDSGGAHGSGYCPAMIFEAGGKRQLIIWHPEAVESLDPETGKVYWSQPFTLQAGLSVPTPRKVGDMLFVTAFYNGPLMLKLDPEKPAASILWKGKSNSERETDGLHSIIPTPFIKDGYIYGVCSYGQLRCLKADTGERVWETFKATTAGGPVRWANAFIIPNGDRYFLLNERGDLIIANLSPKGYEEIDRVHVLEPTGRAGMNRRPDDVLWSHPAFANKNMYLRNDKEIICVSLAAE
jgi:outer membrane protein assembly factor BamB